MSGKRSFRSEIPRCTKTIGPILGEDQGGKPIRRLCPGKLTQRGVAPGWWQCEVCGKIQQLSSRDAEGRGLPTTT